MADKLQAGSNCTRKTCDGTFEEPEEGKFVCDSCGNVVGRRSI